MPQIFKALASITVWILFVLGCLTIIINLVMGTLAGEYFGAGPPSLQAFFPLGIAVVSLALSVVCMKLRQMLE